MVGHESHIWQEQKLFEIILEESVNRVGGEEKIRSHENLMKLLLSPVKIIYCSPLYLVDVNNKHLAAIHERMNCVAKRSAKLIR